MTSLLTEVEAVAQKAWASRKFRTAVAVDGSVMSDKAMSVAAGFNYAARSDKLFVLHVTDATKTFLPKNLEPRHLKNKYEGLALEAHVRAAGGGRGGGGGRAARGPENADMEAGTRHAHTAAPPAARRAPGSAAAAAPAARGRPAGGQRRGGLISTHARVRAPPPPAV